MAEMIERGNVNAMHEGYIRETYNAQTDGGKPVGGFVTPIVQFLDNGSGFITMYLEKEAYWSRIAPRIKACNAAVQHELRLSLNAYRLTTWEPALRFNTDDSVVLTYRIVKREVE